MNISLKEIESVSALESFKRYQYLIKRIVDQEVLYSLKSPEDNWASSVVDDHELFPIWSSPEFATNCAVDGWENFKVEKISLSTFQNDLINYVVNEALLLNIFPVRKMTGFVVDSEEFIRDIEEELTKYQ